MNTWKKTKESLGLSEDEISVKVKNLIKRHEKMVSDHESVKNALKDPDISAQDKQEFEDADKELRQRLFDSDEDLKAHMNRLHRDRDLNKQRRERLSKSAGPGRGHKKDRGADQPAADSSAPVIPIDKNAGGKAAPEPQKPADPKEGPKTSQTTSTASTQKAAASPAASSKTSTQSATSTEPKKKSTVMRGVLGFLIGGIVGAFIGKGIK